jgi:two-component system response regulator NreC
MENPVRILLIDDHAVLRAGLHMLLNAEPDMSVVGEAGNVNDGMDKLSALKPDIVLLDISMPEGSSLDFLKEMKARAPESLFIILTMHNDEGYLRLALSAGASGYVLKQAANNELLAAIRVVSQGGTYLHSSHRSILFEGDAARSAPQVNEFVDYDRLSPREKEILLLIAMGYTNRQAAENLFLSEKTIETYKSRVMTKLGLRNRIDLVRYALRLGLIKP